MASGGVNVIIIPGIKMIHSKNHHCIVVYGYLGPYVVGANSSWFGLVGSLTGYCLGTLQFC